VDDLNLDDLEPPRERWVKFGSVEFLVRYCSPREADTFRRRMLQTGIMRQSKEGVEIALGRESDYYRSFAEQYVRDWRGAILPAGEKYSPDRMGRVLANRGDIKSAIEDAVMRAEAFFGSNGSGST
jgi:hypothetical protein